MKKTIKTKAMIEQDLAFEKKAAETWRSDLNSVKENLIEKLGLKLRAGYLPAASWMDIYSAIDKLIGENDGMKSRERGQNTEDKLWHLVRIALKDETIKKDDGTFKEMPF